MKNLHRALLPNGGFPKLGVPLKGFLCYIGVYREDIGYIGFRV